MQLIVSGKNLEVSDWLKDYVEKKVGRLDRYLPGLKEARVELALEHTLERKPEPGCPGHTANKWDHSAW